MGYCMHQREANFHIQNPVDKKKARALAAIKALMTEEAMLEHDADRRMWSDGKLTQIAYSWISTQEVLDAKTFEDAMRAWRWETAYDDIRFLGEKIGNDETLFTAIAQFVTDGSFVEMEGEDGYIWRWVFDGDTVREIAGKVTFDE